MIRLPDSVSPELKKMIDSAIEQQVRDQLEATMSRRVSERVVIKVAEIK